MGCADLVRGAATGGGAAGGGTLISRYLAALPDVVLLCELNPANRYGADAWVAGLWALRLAAAKPW